MTEDARTGALEVARQFFENERRDAPYCFIDPGEYGGWMHRSAEETFSEDWKA